MIWVTMERRFGAYFDVAADRLRAAVWRTRGASLGQRSRVGPRCVIQRPWCFTAGNRCEFEHDVFVKITDDSGRVCLGETVFVGRGVELDISHGLTVGDHTLIAPGCFITDHSHRYAAGASVASQGCEGAPVRIGADVWLGAKAIVLAGVAIGDGAIIGAGALVNRDVAPKSIVAGVPARVVGERR